MQTLTYHVHTRSANVSVCMCNVCVIFTPFAGFLSKTDMRPNYHMSLHATERLLSIKHCLSAVANAVGAPIVCMHLVWDGNHIISSIPILNFGAENVDIASACPCTLQRFDCLTARKYICVRMQACVCV